MQSIRHNNKLVAIQSISLLHRRASIIQEFTNVKVNHMTGHVTLCWSTYFLGDISARNHRFLAEKSPRKHCSVNRADFSPISRREIADFSPRNHCNVNRALLTKVHITVISRREIGDFSARNRREISPVHTTMISRRFLGEKSPRYRRENKWTNRASRNQSCD